MEYYVLLLLVSLFYTVSANDHSDDVGKLLKEMNAKINRLELMLHKMLLATNYNDSNPDMCTLEEVEDHKTCYDKGNIYCTSINLLTKTFTCERCVPGDWRSVELCKPYYVTMEKNLVKHFISGEHVNISITNGTVLGEIIERGEFKAEKCKCNCVWSNYLSNGTNITADGNNQLLFCNTECQKEYYCLVEDVDKGEAACFKRNGECELSNEKLSCSTEKYSGSVDSSTPYPIIEKDCKQMIELLKNHCAITVVIRDEDILTNIVIDKGTKHHWRNAQVNVICSNDAKPSSDITKMCTTAFSSVKEKEHDDIKEKNPEGPPGNNGSGLNSSMLLIIIIIILVLLLVSYYGYHNQWHQKISSYMNGTEAGSEARPAPSNRRGRMKGKYAPLPRAMEETVPCHAD